MALQVGDPVSSLQWLGLLLRHKFNPWPGKFCMLQAQTKKKKKKKKEEEEERKEKKIHLKICSKFLI